ncbi:hypothetical protein [Mycolicibacterium sp. HS_4_1]
MKQRNGLAGAGAVVAALVAGCSGHHDAAPAPVSSSPQPSTSTAHAAGPCTLPHFGNLIEWLHEPGKPDRAIRISDIDAATCEPTLNNWTANLVERPGVCYMIGWESANPGYNNMAVPAPRLPKAMDTIGDGC